MAAPVLDDARTRFGAYALDFVSIHERPLHHITAAEVERLSRMVCEADEILAEATSLTAPDDRELPALIEKIRALRISAARVLAVAGLDGSWDLSEREVITLTARESVEVVQMFLSPPEPDDRLRAAFKEYKLLAGM